MPNVTRGSRGTGHSRFIVVKGGESLDTIARDMSRSSFRVRQHQEAKALLIQNNQITETTPLYPGQILNVNEEPCGGGNSTWSPNVRICPEVSGFSPELLGLLQTNVQSVPAMAALSEQADRSGWDVGMDAITTGAFLVLAADSGFAAGKHMLDEIQVLGRKIVEDATAKFGKDVMLSKQPAKLEIVQRYLRTSANYQKLQQLISTLPKQLKTGLGSHLQPTPNVHAADARWARRLALVEEKGAARYFRSAGSLLEGKIGRFGAFGRGTTFILPAAIGLYNVAKASPSERFQVTIEESVGIGLGAIGTEVGVEIGGIIVLALGLTGVGAFLLLFVAAGAGAYALSEAGKGGVRRMGEFLE